jgi:hypothetical protein
MPGASRSPALKLLVAALVLAICACRAPDGAALDGRVTSVSLPPNTRLAVQICEQSRGDCDRWLYPPSNGTFLLERLDPGPYTVAVFLETANGLAPITSSVTKFLVGQTTVVDLVIPVIPSQQPP